MNTHTCMYMYMYVYGTYKVSVSLGFVKQIGYLNGRLSLTAAKIKLVTVATGVLTL